MRDYGSITASPEGGAIRKFAYLLAGPALVCMAVLAAASGLRPQGVVAEVEPNNDCPGQSVSCGDTLEAAIDPAGDRDLYSFTAAAGQCVSLGAERRPGQESDTDTYLELLDEACGRVLAADDDSGPGTFSLIENFSVPAAGSYVARVRHAAAGGTGGYRLRIACGDPGATNTRCETLSPADTLACGTISLAGSTFCTGNDFTFPSRAASCTRFTADGEDVVYAIHARSGSRVTLAYHSTADGSIYLIKDCADPGGSCVAGSDSTYAGGVERINYQFAAEGTFYLVLDSFGPGTWGAWTLTGRYECEAVPVVPATWGSIKALFR